MIIPDYQWLKNIKPEIGYYITGFVDGEGSFNVSFRRREDHKLGWQVVTSFNVSQKDRVILSFLKKVFGCGTLRARQDGIVYFEVTNVSMLIARIIPFFEKFRFRSANKIKNFSLFKRIVAIAQFIPLTREQLIQIAEIREELNEGRGRKRKYTLQEITK